MIDKEIRANLEAVLNGRLSLYRAGQLESDGFVRKLEDAFCEYLNIKHAIAMNSATSALHTACLACGIAEATVPVLTFSATAASVLQAGAKLKFSDIEGETYGISSTKAKAVIPVHLHGHPADMDSIEADVIIEDCSQAIGAEYKGKKVGTMGDCGVFSFNVWKQINCGEGGMLITSDDEIARKARLIRNHGEVRSDTLGYNYRLTELCAAVLLPQFKELDTNIEKRRGTAEALTERLKEIEGVEPPVVKDNCKHSYFTYPVKVFAGRDELQAALLKQGVYFGKGGYKPLSMIPFYRTEQRFPVAEWCYEHVMFTDEIKKWAKSDINKIVEIIKGETHQGLS